MPCGNLLASVVTSQWQWLSAPRSFLLCSSLVEIEERHPTSLPIMLWEWPCIDDGVSNPMKHLEDRSSMKIIFLCGNNDRRRFVCACESEIEYCTLLHISDGFITYRDIVTSGRIFEWFAWEGDGQMSRSSYRLLFIMSFTDIIILQDIFHDRYIV